MIDKDIINKKIEELGCYLENLEKSKNISSEVFKSSMDKQWQICHGLQLSIQVLMDIGSHILAAIGEKSIEDYTDIIDRLGERNIIPAEFARNIRGMAGLRNILIHEYAELELDRIYEIVQGKLGDFQRFADYITKYIK